MQLDEYQEQPYLLDPFLERMVSPVVTKLRDTLQAKKSSADSRRVANLAKLLYWLTKVRGPKTVGKSPFALAPPFHQSRLDDYLLRSPFLPARGWRPVLAFGPPLPTFRRTAGSLCC